MKKNERLLSATIILAMGVVLSFVTNQLIPIWFPNRVISEDIIFAVFPYIQGSEFVSDIALIGLLTIFIVTQKENIKKYLPYYITTIGIMYCMRAILNMLTPLQRPILETTASEFLRNNIIQNGMFTSGHTGFAFLLFLFIDGGKHPKAKLISAILFIILSISIVISRGHYSIDVAGGIMLTYIIFLKMQPYKEKLKF